MAMIGLPIQKVETRVEWAIRVPTKHFGMDYRIAQSEDAARASLELYRDSERVLNANPEARIVRRFVATTEWEEVE
ncbi:hypothetical protein [Rhodococcus sp. 11-3]|uniref:hypothetical protein n=1 Tax=Rhodococcus sp. 11-3 TaxID=2854796 RepID=UPI00203FD339|nr:hypothetical protein [Rhodococcus sp. 11-3]USC17008.1 hypothetical protein KZJ41_09140 [Rhodococcus sp. 11-3]